MRVRAVAAAGTLATAVIATAAFGAKIATEGEARGATLQIGFGLR
jgi:hypothetical protein